MALPLTISCFRKIQIGFTFLILAHPGSPRQRVVKWMYVCLRYVQSAFLSYTSKYNNWPMSMWQITNNAFSHHQLLTHPTDLQISRIICIPAPVSHLLAGSCRGHQHTHTRLTALFPGLPRWAGTRKVKPIWILLKLETVSGSGISWAKCNCAPRSRQITMPAPHHSVFYRPDALPATQPTASKHWMHTGTPNLLYLTIGRTERLVKLTWVELYYCQFQWLVSCVFMCSHYWEVL